ncbi:MAG: SWIM zinc finger family protein [Chloroflexota bacterium]|mgnify:CR=1 FL=1
MAKSKQSNLPSLSEKDVSEYISDPYFERGQQYYVGGHISDTIRRGSRIEGFCEGSEPTPYHVIVTFDDKGITGNSCSCPMGGNCKHVVALLLAWVHKPRKFEEREEIDSSLDNMGKEELIALVKEMVKRDPQSESLIDTPRPTKGKRTSPVDPKIYRQRIRYAMRGNEDDWRGNSDAAQEIDSVVEIGDGFAEQEDWVNAQIVYQAALDEVLDEYMNTHDEGEISGAMGGAIEGLMKCLKARKEDTGARRELIRVLFDVIKWDLKQGGIGMSDGVPSDDLFRYADAADRAEIRNWIEAGVRSVSQKSYSNWERDAWGELLLKLESFDGDDEQFLQRAKKLGLHRQVFEKLLELKRFDEAMKIARKHLVTSAWERLGIADMLEEAKQEDEARRLVEEGLPQNDDTRLFEWLAIRYERRKDFARALEMLLTRWAKRPDEETYKKIKSVSPKVRDWKQLHDELFAELEKRKDFELLTRLCLLEKDLNAAWEACNKIERPMYGRMYVYADARLGVAKASEKDYPERAIEIYTKEAQALINQQGRENYKAAANYLKRIRDLFSDLNQKGEWEKFISNLREQHRSKPALQDELKKAKL